MSLSISSTGITSYGSAPSFTATAAFAKTSLPSHHPVAGKVATFIEGIRQKLPRDNLRPLETLINHVSLHGVKEIENALKKPQGYFVRFFTEKSWRGWCEPLTPLGRVIARLADFTQSSTSASTLIDRFERTDLLAANQDAAKLLRSINNKETQSFPPHVFLSELKSPNGIVFESSDQESLGNKVGDIGDVDGDGIKDFFFTSYTNAYIIFGGKIIQSPFKVQLIDGNNGCKITLPLPQGIFDNPITMTKLGDVTGDKIDDFLICSPFADNNRGRCSLVYGKKGPWPAVMNVKDLPLDQANTFTGEFAHGTLGFQAAGGADRDGDGINDFVVGAPGDGYNTVAGRAYIIRGGADLTKIPIVLSKPDGKKIIRLQGEGLYSYFGSALAFEGNVGGGPGPDVIIGAPGATVPGLGIGTGTVSVLYDNPLSFDPIINASNLHGAMGFTIIGETAEENIGSSVQYFGNVTGDAIGSIGIGAPDAMTPEGSVSGKVYLLRGVNGERKSPFYLNETDGQNGSIIFGIQLWSQCGISIGTANITNRGLKDIAIGCPLASGLRQNNTGVTIVVFGHTGTWPKIIDPKTFNGTEGLIIDGAQSYDQAGSSVGAIGQYDTIAIGAPGALDGNGVVYIVYNTDTPPSGTTDQGHPTAFIVLESIAAVGLIGAGATLFINIRRRLKGSEEAEMQPLVINTQHTETV